MQSPEMNVPASTHTPSIPKLTERNRLLGVLLPERICYDVQHYDINMDIDVEKKYLKGYVDFTAIAMNDFTRLQVDLAKDMQLNGVWYREEELTASRKEDAVFIDFPAVKAGTEFTFRVKYEGSPQEAKNPPWDGGFIWNKDEMGRDYVSVACEGDGCGLWWPLKDHISDEPDRGARMTFTVPQNLFCVSNGKLVNTIQDTLTGKQSYTWEVKNPINNYNISVQLGNYVVLEDTLQRKSQVETMNHYVLDYHKQVASTVFPQARKVIRFFEKYFGDYQFWDDGYKLVEVSYLGMEHQSAVTYGNVWNNWGGDHRSWTKDYYGIIDGLLFHETAHEWWGNSITATDPAHVWIHEGMAVYSESMFIEQELGYNVMVDFMLRKRKGIQNKVPIVGPENENYWAFGDSYNKGAWGLHTLRHIINDDRIWWDLLKSFALNNAKSNVNTNDFIKHAENKTGTDLDYFFKQYFYDHRPPTLEYYQKDSKLYYKWSNVVNGFKMPIDVDINGIQGRIFPTTEVQSDDIQPHSVIHFRDWEFLVTKKKNPELTG
ncbi:MAG: M1 family metallopeptidase [Candidatus Marinimicrobia bacterium]|jgi:aminopeptidase N|nr:M1 family metallopeptidase [Candidatus Neomarinimicrobiota bacterium]|tara:strand:- start:20906 stop:22540 length:1635 start_codon:yes stop_codon:yes gene_type:complete